MQNGKKIVLWLECVAAKLQIEECCFFGIYVEKSDKKGMVVRMQNELASFVINNAIEMIIIFDKGGKILHANDAANQKLKYTDNLNKFMISDIFPADFVGERAIHPFSNAQEGEFREMMAYRENRTCFPVRAKLVKWEVEEQAYLLMAVDVTQNQFYQKKASNADQEVEEAQKVKSEFIANVTHELRTPVNGILGNTRQIMEIETDEKKQRLLQLIEHGCNDMNALINSILDFSKLEAGKFTLENREFNFRNTIDYVKANYEHKITEKGLNFFVTISPEVPEMIIGDELRIVQILNNLLSNACKFTSVGKIALEVIKTARYENKVELFFMVIDTGIGIDTADQDKLFKSFSQVDASITRKFGGTGLGLNISKQLVELMNGSIHVQSKKNKGTMFSFNIWVDIPQEEQNKSTANKDANFIMHKLWDSGEETEEKDMWVYGTPENIEEIQKKMSKLILCIEMENWEKAESFADIIKQLTQNGPGEVKSAVLRMKMAVQKENYEKSQETFQKVEELIQGKTQE